MNNYNRTLDIQNQLTNSAGTLQMQYAEYMDSVEASANRAKVAFEGMFINTLESDTIKNFYDLITVITKTIDNIGLLNIAVLTLSTIFVTSNNPIQLFIRNIISANGGISKFILNIIPNFRNTMLTLTRSFQLARLNMGVLESGLYSLKVAFGTATVKAIGLKVATFALQAALSIGVAIAIQGFIKLASSIIESNEKQREFIETQKKTYNQTKQNITQLETLVTQYSKATKGTEEYKNVQDQISSIMPQVIKYYNENGEAVYANAQEVRALIKEEKELNALRAKRIADSVVIDMEEEFKELNKTQKDITQAQNEYNNAMAKMKSVKLVDSFLNSDDIKELDKNSNEYKNKVDNLLNSIQESYIRAGGNTDGNMINGLVANISSALVNDEYRNQLRSNIESILNESDALLDGYSANADETLSKYANAIKDYNVFLADEYGITDQNLMNLLNKYVDYFVDQNDITDKNVRERSNVVKKDLDELAQYFSGKDIDFSELFESNSLEELESNFNNIKGEFTDTELESDKLQEVLSMLKSQVEDNIDSTKEYINVQDELSDSMNESADKISESIDAVEKTKSILDKLSDDGMSLDLVQDIADNYPELLSYIGDEVKLRGLLKDKIDEQYGSLNNLINAQGNTISLNEVLRTENIKVASTQDLLSQAIRQTADSGFVNKSVMEQLFEIYPELKNKAIDVAGGYKIEQGALIDLNKAAIKQAISQIKTEKEKTQSIIKNTEKRIRAIIAEAKANSGGTYDKYGNFIPSRSSDPRLYRAGNALIEAYSLSASYSADIRELQTLLNSINLNSTRLDLSNYSSGSNGSSGSDSSSSTTSTDDAFNNWMGNLGRNSELAEHQLEMNKLNQQYEQGIENSNEFIKLKIQEGMIYEDLNDIYQSNIDKIKAKMRTVSKSSDEYNDLQNTLNDYTQSMRQNEIAIIDNKQALEDYNKTLRDGVIDAQELVMDAVKERARLEYEANKQILEDRIEFLNKEKQLLRSEYDLRQQEKEEQNRQEKLVELQNRYNKLSLDNSGMYEKEKLDLQNEITSLQEDIYESNLEKEINAQENALDNQIENYEKEKTVMEEHYSQLEEDNQQYWKEVENIMQGSQDNIINFLKENNDEYRKAGELQREAYLEGWGDTINFAKDVTTGDLKTSEEIEKTTPRPNTSNPSLPPSNNNSSNSSESSKSYPYGKVSNVKAVLKKGSKGSSVKALQWALKDMGYSMGGYGVDGSFGYYTDQAVRKFQKNMGILVDGSVGNQTKSKFKTKGYSKGGIVDYTGIANVHGTQDAPEAFLNAQQTGIFQKLTSLLEKSPLSISNGSSLSKLGSIDKSMIINSNFGDININVEKLENEADYEKIGNKVKDSIYNTIKGLGLTASIPKVR